VGLGVGMGDMAEQGDEDAEDERARKVVERAGRPSTEGSEDRHARELTESPLAEVTEAFVGLGRGWGSSLIVR
jgi:hypothetical protein